MLRQQIAIMTQQLYDKSIKIKSLWIKSTYTCIGAQAALQWHKIEFWQFLNRKLIK